MKKVFLEILRLPSIREHFHFQSMSYSRRPRRNHVSSSDRSYLNSLTRSPPFPIIAPKRQASFNGRIEQRTNPLVMYGQGHGVHSNLGVISDFPPLLLMHQPNNLNKVPIHQQWLEYVPDHPDPIRTQVVSPKRLPDSLTGT